jgi:hypothetical protein
VTRVSPRRGGWSEGDFYAFQRLIYCEFADHHVLRNAERSLAVGLVEPGAKLMSISLAEPRVLLSLARHLFSKSTPVLFDSLVLWLREVRA